MERITPGPDVDPNGPMTFAGVTGTFEELRDGVVSPDGRRVVWLGNKRRGEVRCPGT